MLFPNVSSDASLGSVEDFSNPRIVPMYNDPRSDWVAYSGFLYSPRIVFTVAHSEYFFDNNGNKIDRSPKETFAGMPNSRAALDAPRVKVIKRILSKTYRFNNATLGDFAVFILEKDLADVKPAKLLTPEIQAELLASNAELRMHGYGAFSDSCNAGQTLPCATNIQERSKVPRMLKAKLYELSDIEKFVGYQRPQLRGSLTFFAGGKSGGCSGDSGGSSTVLHQGELLYVTVTGNAMNSYACGATSFFDGVGGIFYSSPVYEHLDIIKEAEEFVAKEKQREFAKAEEERVAAELRAKQEAEAKAEVEAKANTSKKKTTITCVKGKEARKVTSVNPRCPKGYKKK